MFPEQYEGAIARRNRSPVVGGWSEWRRQPEQAPSWWLERPASHRVASRSVVSTHPRQPCRNFLEPLRGCDARVLFDVDFQACQFLDLSQSLDEPRRGGPRHRDQRPTGAGRGAAGRPQSAKPIGLPIQGPRQPRADAAPASLRGDAPGPAGIALSQPAAPDIVRNSRHARGPHDRETLAGGQLRCHRIRGSRRGRGRETGSRRRR